jgi:hypothetical protein
MVRGRAVWGAGRMMRDMIATSLADARLGLMILVLASLMLGCA